MSEGGSEDIPVGGPGRGGPIAPSSTLWFLGAAAGILVFYFASDLLFVLILSVVLAYLINPIVKIAESALIKRETAATAVYLAIGASLIITALFLLPRLHGEINTLSRNLPSFTERLDEALDLIQGEIATHYPDASRLFSGREVRYDRLNAFVERQAEDLPGLIGHLAFIALAAVLIPFFSYFFLRDSRKIIQFVLDRVPAAHIETSVAVWCEIDGVVGRYLRGLAVDVTVVAVLASLGLWILGVNYPLLLGALSGLANIVPYFGPIVGGVAAMLVATVQFKSLAPLAQVFALYLSLKLLDVFVVQPIAVGRSQHLHPVLLIASVIVGGHAMGIAGMIIAVPTVTIFQEIAKLLFERRRRNVAAAGSRRSSGAPVQPYVC